ncbi:MAG: transposase [Hyphomicrobiales bacterium]|nr:transposase [Hyphomicrobiales bacterium]
MRKRHSFEEIIVKLRQVDDLVSQKWSVLDTVTAIGLTAATYYRWRAAYDGMYDRQGLRDDRIESDQLKRLQQLEAENALLRKAVADLMHEKTILSKIVRTDS